MMRCHTTLLKSMFAAGFPFSEGLNPYTWDVASSRHLTILRSWRKEQPSEISAALMHGRFLYWVSLIGSSRVLFAFLGYVVLRNFTLWVTRFGPGDSEPKTQDFHQERLAPAAGRLPSRRLPPRRPRRIQSPYIHIYIYIYIERERERYTYIYIYREREREPVGISSLWCQGWPEERSRTTACESAFSEASSTSRQASRHFTEFCVRTVRESLFAWRYCLVLSPA